MNRYKIKYKIAVTSLAALLSLQLCACTGQNAEDQTTVGDSCADNYEITATTDISASDEYSADVTFTFDETSISASGANDGYEISGTDLKIDSPGTYLITGTCSDGSVTVKKSTTDVILLLDGIDLSSSDTAPIVCAKSTQVKIVAMSGSENTLSDSIQNNDEEYTDNTDAENAVIKCKDGSNVTICGDGTINIISNGKNGIKSGASTDTEGEASLTIKEVTLNISASVNDAINAEQLLNIESGTLNISAADDAIHSDIELNIGSEGTDGPSITISSSVEGIEASSLNIMSGDINITSSDDCLNAANSDLGNYDFVINISGGSINAYTSGGDGFDSNGDLNISGGQVIVWSANMADNQPLDADGTINVTGGVVLAAGASNGMGSTISADQAYVTFGSSMGTPGAAGTINDGDTISINDNNGNVIFTCDAMCNAQYVFFSSGDLADGTDYSLYVNGTSTASATSQTGTASSDGTNNMGGGMNGGMNGGMDMPGGGGRGADDMPGDPNGMRGMQQPDF